MARRRPRFLQKVRTREHIVGDLAVNHVERQVHLAGFTVERIVHDYGLDLTLYTFDADSQLEDGPILLQVKGTERLDHLKLTGEIAFRIDRADLRTWLGNTFPVFLIVYDVSGDVAYWLYVQQHFGRAPGFDLAVAA